MKYLVIIALFLLVSCNAPTPYTTARAATFLATVQGGTGSAVHIGGGYMLTAQHVQMGLIVHIADEREDAIYASEMIKVDVENDLCLVRIKRRDLPKVAIALHELEIGEVIIVTGYHHGQALLTTKGIKSGTKGMSDHHYTSDLTVNPGCSGGPVVNEDGELVGIVQARSGGLMFYVGLDKIREFLKGELKK